MQSQAAFLWGPQDLPPPHQPRTFTTLEGAGGPPRNNKSARGHIITLEMLICLSAEHANSMQTQSRDGIQTPNPPGSPVLPANANTDCASLFPPPCLSLAAVMLVLRNVHSVFQIILPLLGWLVWEL